MSVLVVGPRISRTSPNVLRRPDVFLSPALSHLVDDVVLRNAKEAGNLDAMDGIHDDLVAFPVAEGCGIDPELLGELNDTEPHPLPLVAKLLADRGSWGLGDVSQELLYGGVVLEAGRVTALLPEENDCGAGSEDFGHIFLVEAKEHPLTLDVLPNGLGVCGDTVRFQALKRDAGVWQKGNAALPVWISRRLIRQVPLHAARDCALSQPHLRPAARSDRSESRGGAGVE
jgi:hypothetical protein